MKLTLLIHNFTAKLTCLQSALTLSPQDAVAELKERVRSQYQRMHALLEANQAETMQMLDSTYTMYARKSSQQALQLNGRRQDAEKLLSSVQTFFQRADSINFMKVQICSSLSVSPSCIRAWTATEYTHHQEMFYSICIYWIKCWISKDTNVLSHTNFSFLFSEY